MDSWDSPLQPTKSIITNEITASVHKCDKDSPTYLLQYRKLQQKIFNRIDVPKVEVIQEKYTIPVSTSLVDLANESTMSLENKRKLFKRKHSLVDLKAVAGCSLTLSKIGNTNIIKNDNNNTINNDNQNIINNDNQKIINNDNEKISNNGNKNIISNLNSNPIDELKLLESKCEQSETDDDSKGPFNFQAILRKTNRRFDGSTYNVVDLNASTLQK